MMAKKRLRGNSVENLIADQIFKITPSDDQFMDYIKDCNDYKNPLKTAL